MRVWKLLSNEKSMAVEVVNSEEFPIFEGTSVKDHWRPIELKVYRKGRHRDLVYLTGGVPVFNENSADRLIKIIEDEVELLNTTVINLDIALNLVNVTNVVDAVDFSRSLVERDPWGKVSIFKKVAFIEERVADQTIFKTPEHLRSIVYATDRFRNAVLEAKLKGFEFRLAWDSEITDEMVQATKARYEALLADIERKKGPEFAWGEAVARVEQGRTVVSGVWKMRRGRNGIMEIARLKEDCEYGWLQSNIVPPILFGLQWHEVEEQG